jgi:hypothetical protein
MQGGIDTEVIKLLVAQGAFSRAERCRWPPLRPWGVHAVPASFIISPDGQIRLIEVGYTTGPGLRLRLWLVGLMGQANAVFNLFG